MIAHYEDNIRIRNTKAVDGDIEKKSEDRGCIWSLDDKRSAKYTIAKEEKISQEIGSQNTTGSEKYFGLLDSEGEMKIHEKTKLKIQLLNCVGLFSLITGKLLTFWAFWRTISVNFCPFFTRRKYGESSLIHGVHTRGQVYRWERSNPLKWTHYSREKLLQSGQKFMAKWPWLRPDCSSFSRQKHFHFSGFDLSHL